MSAMTTIHEAQSSPVDREPLYSPAGHKLVRIVFGSALAFQSAGIGIAMVMAARNGKGRDLLIAGAMASVIALFAKFVFRSKAIYGSPRGLEYKENGQWRTVPWKNVGSPDFNWLRSAIFVREATVDITGDDPTTIRFYATKYDIEAFKRLRDAGLARESAEKKAS